MIAVFMDASLATCRTLGEGVQHARRGRRPGAGMCEEIPAKDARGPQSFVVALQQDLMRTT
jgi:hypothetical protein